MPTNSQLLADIKREQAAQGRDIKEMKSDIIVLKEWRTKELAVDEYRSKHKGSNGNGKKMSDVLFKVILALTTVLLALVALLK